MHEEAGVSTVQQAAAPLVSVVMATYNRERYVGMAVRSVIAQTFGNWELIVVDDGSKDDTVAVLQPLLADPRIRYFHQENKGQATARNRGLQAAHGELVCFMDSDNLWLPQKLQRQLELLRDDVDVLYGEDDIIDEEGRVQPSMPMRRYSVGHAAAADRQFRHLQHGNGAPAAPAGMRRPR